jgi:hypothetical protein
VRDEDDKLTLEQCIPSLLDRAEGVVVQYMAVEGWQKYLSDCKILRCFSGVHTGPGQIPFGLNHRDKMDATIVAETESGLRVVLFYNYHGAYFHYMGHREGCRVRYEQDRSLITHTKFIGKPRDAAVDKFRTAYAECMSKVYPNKCAMTYVVEYECDYMHGNYISRPEKFETKYSDLKELLKTEYAHETIATLSKRSIKQKDLVDGILNGTYTGFVHLSGGTEHLSGAASKFGFCVQQYAPKARELGDYTIKEIKDYFGMKTDALALQFVQKSSPRTLNSTGFHSKETISTSYLRWLMTECKFRGFKIYHYIYYPFRNYKSEFMKPILQQRHECKLQGKMAEAEALKLIANGNFGFNGIQSSNYNDTTILTESALKRSKSLKLAAHNVMHSHIMGLVNTAKRRKARLKKKYGNLAPRERIDKVPDNYEFLVSITSSGGYKPIRNTIAQAVSTLSNSKVIFLQHVKTMLECLDPALAEICYTDTDSCIWATKFKRLDQCLLDSERAKWAHRDIIANETGSASCHGKMKLEGIYRRGVFRSVKIYRLYGQVEASSAADDDDDDDDAYASINVDDASCYTRCKGIAHSAGKELNNEVFTNASRVWSTEKTSIRPSQTYEIVIQSEGRNLAIPFNLKRYAMEDGVHTLPVSMFKRQKCR